MIVTSPPPTLTGRQNTGCENDSLKAPVGLAPVANWPIFPILVICVARAPEKPYIFAAMPFRYDHLNSILLKLLQPLARLFLHFGVSYREFCELSKVAFVVVASDDFGVHGRPTNASRIAAMTGLTRKDVGQIRLKIESGDASQTNRQSPINEVLSAWFSTDEFLDARGQPRRLPLKGESASFESLVRQFAGDIPEGALRKELLRIEAIELVDNTVRIRKEGLAKLEADKRQAGELLIEPYELLQAAARKVNR